MYKILLFTLLLAAALADCPLNPYPRRTALGYVQTFLNNDPNLHGAPQEFIYTLNEPFQTNSVSVTLGIVGLQLNSHSKIDFSIANVPHTNFDSLKFHTQVSDNQWGWRKVRFNFFATTYQSLFLSGSGSADQFSIGLKEGEYSLYRMLPNIDNYNLRPVVRVFLTGVDLSAKPLEEDVEYQSMVSKYESYKRFSTNTMLLKIIEEAIKDKESLKLKIYDGRVLGSFLTFKIETNTNLHLLKFSYLIFSDAVMTTKHNYVQGNFTILKDNEYRFTTLNNMDMLLTGLTNFHIPRNNNYLFSLGFRNYLGQGYFTAKTTHNYLEASFHFLAVEMKQLYVCEDCPDNAYIIHENKFCVQACPRTFSVSQRLGNSFCDKCEVQKLKVVDPNTGNCVCAKRHYWNQTLNSCSPCLYDCMTCERGDQCLTCDNALLQTSRKLVSGRCSCPSTGFYDDSAAEDIVCHECATTCLTCSGPRSHDCLSCAVGKELDSYGHCVCSNHFIEVSPGVCACPIPNIIVSGYCVNPNESCGQNQVQQFVDLTQKCVCAQGTYQVLNTCVKCPPNSIFSEQDLKCICINNTVMVNGECVACRTNMAFDSISKLCVCELGTFKADDGTCVKCPVKMTYINGQCECIFNYFEASAGVCRKCLRETDGPKCRRNQF